MGDADIEAKISKRFRQNPRFITNFTFLFFKTDVVTLLKQFECWQMIILDSAWHRLGHLFEQSTPWIRLLLLAGITNLWRRNLMNRIISDVDGLVFKFHFMGISFIFTDILIFIFPFLLGIILVFIVGPLS